MASRLQIPTSSESKVRQLCVRALRPGLLARAEGAPLTGTNVVVAPTVEQASRGAVEGVSTRVARGATTVSWRGRGVEHSLPAGSAAGAREGGKVVGWAVVGHLCALCCCWVARGCAARAVEAGSVGVGDQRTKRTRPSSFLPASLTILGVQLLLLLLCMYHELSFPSRSECGPAASSLFA